MAANRVSLLTAAIGVLALEDAMGVSSLTATPGVSAPAATIGNCAEAGVGHSRKQNNAGNMVLIGKSTSVEPWGEGTLGLSSALAGTFVMQQIQARGIERHVSKSLSGHRTTIWTRLMTSPYFRVHRSITATAPFRIAGELFPARAHNPVRILVTRNNVRCSLLYSGADVLVRIRHFINWLATVMPLNATLECRIARIVQNGTDSEDGA
jgi:hypothetical protein